MKRLLFALCTLLTVLFLSACSDWENWERTPLQDLSAFYEQENKSAAPILPEVFALPYFPHETLDPITCSDGVQQTVGTLLYEGLYALDASFRPQPVLAENAVFNENMTELTVTPRQVYFSDGSPLTAQDIVSTLQRAAQSARYGARLQGMRSVRAVDNTVVITLQEANASFISLLDIPICKENPYNDLAPLGTGAYAIGDNEVLVRSDYYEGESLPTNTIALFPCKNTEAANYAFTCHDIHLLRTDLTGSSTVSSVSTGQSTDAVTAIMQYIGFRVDHIGLSRPEIRRAISLAIDRVGIVNTCLLGHGIDTRLPLTAAQERLTDDPLSPVTYDAINEAMEQAGLATGTKLYHLELLVNSENQFRVNAAQSVADTLQRYDLEVSVRALPWEQYLYDLEHGRYDLYYGECALTADGDMTQLFGTDGVLNYGGYSDVQTDELLTQYRSSGSSADLTALCRRFLEESPIAPICFKSVTVMTANGVVDMITPTATNPFYDPSRWSMHLAQSQTVLTEKEP